MANQILGTRSPNGDVGVDGVLDSAELNAYTQGILSGFEPSVSGWDITLSSGSGQSSCIARNADGLSDIFAGVGDITFTIDGAPATSGHSRIDALVAYKDATLVSEVSNGLDTVDYMVVQGTAGGSPNSPSMQDIRNAVPNGEEAFISILGEVYLNYGAGLTLGRIAIRRAKVRDDIIRIEDSAALPMIPPAKMAGLYCNARLRDTEDGKNIPAAVTQIFMELQDRNQISWTEGGINKTAQFIFNDGKIIVPAGVSLVLVSAGMTFTATGNVNLNLYIRKNNVNFANAIRRPYDSATPIQHLVTGAHVVSVTEGDEISLVAFGASTVSLAATTIVGRNYLSIAALA